jgi:hypothetical protein
MKFVDFAAKIIIIGSIESGAAFDTNLKTITK